MKIYELNISDEKEWMCANTAIQALKNYQKITGILLNDFEDEDDIIEVPVERWGDLTVYFPDEDKEPQTFLELMKEINEPTYLCSTSY